MTVRDVIVRATAAYKSERVVEDSVFITSVLLEYANAAHRKLAEAGLRYWVERSADIVANDGRVELAADIIRIENESVVLFHDTEYRPLPRKTAQQLRRDYGPLQARQPGTPGCFYQTTGDTAETARAIQLFPKPDFSQAGGLLYSAYIYPAVWANEQTEVPLGDGEGDKLTPLICQQMAAAELSRGVRQAPVAYWTQLAEAAITAFEEEAQRARRTGPRRVNYVSGAYD